MRDADVACWAAPWRRRTRESRKPGAIVEVCFLPRRKNRDASARLDVPASASERRSEGWGCTMPGAGAAVLVCHARPVTSSPGACQLQPGRGPPHRRRRCGERGALACNERMIERRSIGQHSLPKHAPVVASAGSSVKASDSMASSPSSQPSIPLVWWRRSCHVSFDCSPPASRHRPVTFRRWGCDCLKAPSSCVTGDSS